MILYANIEATGRFGGIAMPDESEIFEACPGSRNLNLGHPKLQPFEVVLQS